MQVCHTGMHFLSSFANKAIRLKDSIKKNTLCIAATVC